MKKLRALGLLSLLLTRVSLGQTNTFPASGNVGIGTTSPVTALHLKSGVFMIGDASRSVEISSQSTADQTISLGRYRLGANIWIEARIEGTYGEYGGTYHLIGDWGKVPVIAFRSEWEGATNALKFYGYKDPGNSGYCFLFATWDNYANYNNIVRLKISSVSDFNTSSTGTFASASELQTTFSIRGINGATTGNVGIGTTKPTHKLSVNGAIRAKEVIVDTNWADYVFAKDYRLAPLSEVEAHIKAHGHLPDMPSATAVATNGVGLGEMQAKLLAKVEELTLHMIELKKENAQLREELESLKEE